MTVWVCVLCVHTTIVCWNDDHVHRHTGFTSLVTLDELLKLIHRLSPQPNLCVKSVYTFNQSDVHMQTLTGILTAVCIICPLRMTCIAMVKTMLNISSQLILSESWGQSSKVQLYIKSYWVLAHDMHYNFVLCCRQEFLELAWSKVKANFVTRRYIQWPGVLQACYAWWLLVPK